MTDNRRRGRTAAANENSFEAVFDPFDLASSTADDEALARALQEEFQAAEASSVPPSTAAPNSVPSPRTQQQQQDEAYARELQASLQQQSSLAANATTSTRAATTVADYTATNSSNSAAAIASSQSLYASPQRRSLPSSQNPSYRRKYPVTPMTSRSSSGVSAVPPPAPEFDDVDFCTTEDDEFVARRVSQELQDEDFARNLTLQEEEKLSRQRALRQQQRQASQPPPGIWKRFLCYLIPIFIIAASAGAVLYYVVYGPSSLPDWMPNPEQFANEDPFQALGPNETSRWNNQGHGIELQVLNSLTDEWYPYFYTAVDQWDNGSPDSLTLKTTAIRADASCKTVARTLKVCNGDYGETSWRGINKLLLEGNSIYASAARMNEFYFGTNDFDQRQYTMCHEIGHGFGLPHTDENFNNKDLGNCMDYTNRPQNNKQPSIDNFNFLQELYGVVPGSQTSVMTTSSSNAVPEEQQQQTEDSSTPDDFQDIYGDNGNQQQPQDEQRRDNKGNKKKNRKKKVRRLKGQATPAHARTQQQQQYTDASYPAAEHPSVPHRVLRSLESVEEEIENGLWVKERGWRLLHRSQHGEAHEKDLGDGFRVQVHLLRA